MIILGIDPGPTKSGVALISRLSPDEPIVGSAAVVDNHELLYEIKERHYSCLVDVAIEDITCYGARIGKETIETAVFIGRLIETAERADHMVFRYPRREYGIWITGGETSTDKAIRGALEATYGGYKKGEPLFALKSGSHVRSAFAVAKYHEYRACAAAKSVASCGEQPGQTSFLEVEK